MASKITTNNPNHHKYVDTNKYERKKHTKRHYSLPVKEHNLSCLKAIHNIFYIIAKYPYLNDNSKNTIISVRHGYGKIYTGTRRKNYSRKFYAKPSRLKYTTDELNPKTTVKCGKTIYNILKRHGY